MANTTKLSSGMEEMDHIQGPPKSGITLVVYGDYECPYTLEATTFLHQLRSRYPNDLRFVYRHFPLTEKHPHAWRAAEAAEAAGAQDRFWEMHRLLFVGYPRLGEEDLRDYARQLYLDMVQFEAALVQHTYADRIKRDVESGKRSGVTGTPTYFINGTRYEGPDDLTGLVTAIEQALGHKVPQ